MRIILGFLACLLLAACSSSTPSSSDIRAEFTQNLPGLLELKDFKLEDGHNVGSGDEPVWVARFTATVTPREATYDIDTVAGDVRILKPVRAAGEAMSLYGTVRSTRSGDKWTYQFQSDGSSNPVIGRPRSDYGPDALVAGSPEAKALLAKIAHEKEQARIAEESRLAAEAAERKQKEQAEAAKRKRIEAAVAKYHAAFATDDLGRMVDPGTRRSFLVTAKADDRDRVWGTDVYTCDSSFAKTVVHAGLLQPGESGVVEVAASRQRQDGGFVGSPRHGVNSENQTSYRYACTIRLLERISNE
jgi:hypothetical protein